MPVNIALFAHGNIGLETVRFIVSHFSNDLKLVVTTAEDDISTFVKEKGINTCIYSEINEISGKSILSDIDLGILAWWPKIIKKYIIDLSKKGFINFHPSLLPYNRGKHYNFWTIVEDCPFGVTLHYVNEGIDTGEILFQKEIKKTWEDTGESLYNKAQAEILQLFKDSYPLIRQGTFTPQTQDLNIGSTHFAKEIDLASEIHLDKKYNARELLNLLRARTFEGKPGCYFFEGNEKFEISIKIKKIN